MGKTKIALTILLLLIVSAILMVTVFKKEGSEADISPIQAEGEEFDAKPVTPDNQDVTIEKQVDGSDVTKLEDTADDYEEAINEITSSSGVDIKTDHEEMAEQFNNEEMDYHWSGYWENELRTVVLFIGAKAFVESSEVECKSSTCEVTVNLSVNEPQNTVEAVGALSDEFAQRELKFVPASIDPENGEIVFYTQPGDIPE